MILRAEHLVKKYKSRTVVKDVSVQVEQGEIAAVRIGDEATLKHVYLHENFIELRPENPAFESIILTKEEMNTVVIEGKAVGLCRDI